MDILNWPLKINQFINNINWHKLIDYVVVEGFFFKKS